MIQLRWIPNKMMSQILKKKAFLFVCGLICPKWEGRRGESNGLSIPCKLCIGGKRVFQTYLSPCALLASYVIVRKILPELKTV